jgi:N-acetylglutamate synthase-like GNAT family acetyltransferase
MKTMLNIRRAHPSDVSAVVKLVRAYAGEIFGREAAVTAEALLDDGFGSVLEFCVAENHGGDLVGFAAWEKTYDLVSGTRGGALLGLYVAPSARGAGSGYALLANVAHEIRGIGGSFLLSFEEGRSRLAPESGSSLSIFPRPELRSKLEEAADLSLNEIESIRRSLRPQQ